MFSEDLSMIDRCYQTKLLVIDELQLKDNKSWTFETLEDIVRHRVMHRLSTIVCSNHEINELREFRINKKFVMNGVLSVMKETFEIMVVKGKDFRQ